MRETLSHCVIAIVIVLFCMYPSSATPSQVRPLRLRWFGFSLAGLIPFLVGLLLCPVRFYWMLWIVFFIGLFAAIAASRRDVLRFGGRRRRG
jgi:hypothetical protein